jgi:hypothetical protein
MTLTAYTSINSALAKEVNRISYATQELDVDTVDSMVSELAETEGVRAVAEAVNTWDNLIGYFQSQIDTAKAAIAELESRKSTLSDTILRLYLSEIFPAKVTDGYFTVSVVNTPSSTKGEVSPDLMEEWYECPDLVDGEVVDSQWRDCITKTQPEYKLNKKRILERYKQGLPLPPGITVQSGLRVAYKG